MNIIKYVIKWKLSQVGFFSERNLIGESSLYKHIFFYFEVIVLTKDYWEDLLFMYMYERRFEYWHIPRYSLCSFIMKLKC